MKLLYLAMLITMFTSCEKREYIEVYACEPIDDDSVIRGHNLNKFFNKTDDKRKIDFQKINLTQNLNNEIDKLKDYLENKGNVDKGIGIYYFALIRGNDTLYSSSDLESWKYSNLVNVYKSNLIKNTILGNSSN